MTLSSQARQGPFFSVIIPTWGRPGLLNDAVASVLAQTITDLECIVVDDAGPDPPALPDDGRLRLVRRAVNGGTAAARNSGLEVATGRYVTFMDDDDIFAPDRLAMSLPGFERAHVVSCWSRFLDGPEQPNRVLEGDVRDTILDSLVPHVGATTVRRDLALPFDEALRSAEDVDWWFRMAHTTPVATETQFGYLIRRHSGLRYGKSPAVRIQSRLEILERQRAYFATHRRAAAFQWKRIGLLALKGGEVGCARRALVRSALQSPNPRTLWHLARSLVKRSRPIVLGSRRPRQRDV